MTSMTMVGGLIAPAPQWRLGELSDVLREHMNTKVDSLDQVTLYMQRNDADLLYGTRMLTQLDAIIADLRRNGISRDLAVAVESARPGTIPKNIQKILTSNYTKIHQNETVAALESWREAGKLGLIIMAVTAVLKLLSWLMSNGTGYKGPSTNWNDRRENMQKYAEKIKVPDAYSPDAPTTSKSPAPVAVASIDKMVSLAVKDAYISALKHIDKSTDETKLTVAAMRLDQLLSKAKGIEAIDNAAYIAGFSPFTAVMISIARGETSSNDIIDGAITALLYEFRLGDAVFTRKGAGLISALMPDSFQSAGIMVPNDVTFKVCSARFGELDGYFKQMSHLFDRLRKVDFTADKVDLSYVQGSLVEAITQLNDVMTVLIPDVSAKGIRYDSMPCVAMLEKQAQNVIGYSDPIEFINNKVLLAAGYESYLNASSWYLLKEKGLLNDSEQTKVLAAICSMAELPHISTDTRITNIDGYRKLEQEVTAMIKGIETWQKEMSRAKIDINKIGHDIVEALSAQRSDSLNMGRELSMEYRDNADFFMVMRKQMAYVRQISRGVIGMNRVAEASGRNVLIKASKK